ncbi:hypothetical protein ACQUQU_02205 [Thalassolituus sp. LLYu03]|uniref:hypothetical protein n=1 Tax=Thalassolituus sp. LLYu03 TaxID=3421656 RepID=UPI003D2B1F26
MLSALTSYLQQQPVPLTDTQPQTTAVSDAPTADAANNSDLQGLYAPSQRAVMVSAVAMDFDVRSLTSDDAARLQQKLQQYGLINGPDLNALALINTARADLNDGDTLDAVAILDDARSGFSERGTAYSERQQISRLHTLIHNIASARVTQ